MNWKFWKRKKERGWQEVGAFDKDQILKWIDKYRDSPKEQYT